MSVASSPFSWGHFSSRRWLMDQLRFVTTNGNKLERPNWSLEQQQLRMSSWMPALLLPPSPLPALFTILVLPLSLLLLLRLALQRNLRARAHGMPPSPPKLPFIGNFHQLGSLPHRSLHALSQKHGPLMLLHLGQVPTLVVSSPDGARDVMRNHDQVFASRPALKPAKVLLNDSKDLGFAPYGEHWRQLRKICAVHLLSSIRVQSYRLIREEEVGFMIRKISSRASPTTTSVDMSEILYSLFNDIICRVVSGKFTREEGRNVLFRELIGEISVLLSKFYVGDYFPWLGWLDVLFGSMARAKKNKKRWDDLLDGVIQEHEDRSAKGDDGEKDFVDVLLSLREDPGNHALLTPQTIKALLMDIFTGGTDTSYVTLEYAMAELVRSPRAMAKLQHEVRGTASRKGMVKEEELNEMVYLKAIIKEALRLYPPVPLLVPRELMEDCQIQGYDVPKKTRVIVNAWGIGRDPSHWEAPDEFKPERFMGDGAMDFKGNHFEFTPFGAGRRICPGMSFAIASLELALANLVYHFDWELPGGLTSEDLDMTEVSGLVQRRKQGLQLVAKPWSIGQEEQQR
ncbi:cytochrome P450 [Musa troglodytarum]|uniref:Cytochrome P450 n=2 Tax=Musa troglodytarum TaxID=320322 RepID=A0A9E7JHU9_9LILI|nr:cytochrome P450 [Musa troglodytarum]